jgi:hypothetical protein
MSLQEELFDIEVGFWLSGQEHFLNNLDNQCLLAFPQMGEMHGIYSRELIAGTAAMPNRWRDLEISDQHSVQISADAVILSYRAVVTRADGEPYSALVSSAYVRRPQGWKLVFHQHSPV